ncbi:Phosphatase and actin regulator [Balamuthia mandrillaris]
MKSVVLAGNRSTPARALVPSLAPCKRHTALFSVPHQGRRRPYASSSSSASPSLPSPSSPASSLLSTLRSRSAALSLHQQTTQPLSSLRFIRACRYTSSSSSSSSSPKDSRSRSRSHDSNKKKQEEATVTTNKEQKGEEPFYQEFLISLAKLSKDSRLRRTLVRSPVPPSLLEAQRTRRQQQQKQQRAAATPTTRSYLPYFMIVKEEGEEAPRGKKEKDKYAKIHPLVDRLVAAARQLRRNDCMAALKELQQLRFMPANDAKLKEELYADILVLFVRRGWVKDAFALWDAMLQEEGEVLQGREGEGEGEANVKEPLHDDATLELETEGIDEGSNILPKAIAYKVLMGGCISAIDPDGAAQVLHRIQNDRTKKGAKYAAASGLADPHTVEHILRKGFLVPFVLRDRLEEGLELLKREGGLKCLNTPLFNKAIMLCIEHGAVEKAFDLYEVMKREGVAADRMTYTMLLGACENKHHLDRAFLLFDEMCSLPALLPSLSEFNALMQACVSANEPERGLQVLQHMQDRGVTPNEQTLIPLISCFAAQQSTANRAFELLRLVRETINIPRHLCDQLLYNCSIIGDLNRATQLIEFMEQIEASSGEALLNQENYCMLIDACVNAGHEEKAFDVLARMRERGIKPEAKALLSIVQSANKLPTLYKAINAMQEMEIEPTAELINSFILTSGRIGEIGIAEELFANLQKGEMGAALSCDQFSYNCLIGAYGAAKDITGALGVWKERVTKHPTEVDLHTCSAIIYACGEAGRPWLAMSILREMQAPPLCLTPTVDQYNLLLIALVKSRKVKEAFQVFAAMKQEAGIKPNSITFQTLISSCGKLDTAIQTAPSSTSFYYLCRSCTDPKQGIELLRMMQKEIAHESWQRYCRRSITPYLVIMDLCLNNGQPKLVVEAAKLMLTQGFFWGGPVVSRLGAACSMADTPEQMALEILSALRDAPPEAKLLHTSRMDELVAHCQSAQGIKEAHALVAEAVAGAQSPSADPSSIASTSDDDSTFVIHRPRKRVSDALDVLQLMEQEGQKAYPGIFSSLLEVCAVAKDRRTAEAIWDIILHGENASSLLPPDSSSLSASPPISSDYSSPSSSTSLLDQPNRKLEGDEGDKVKHVLSTRGREQLTRLAKLREPGLEPSIVLFNSYLAVLASYGDIDLALQQLDHYLPQLKLFPNFITYNVLINACAKRCQNVERKARYLQAQEQLSKHEEIMLEEEEEEDDDDDDDEEEAEEENRQNSTHDREQHRQAVDSDAGKRAVNTALELIRRMQEPQDLPSSRTCFRPNNTTLSSLMECYASQGMWQEAQGLVDELQAEGGIAPTRHMFCSLMNAYLFAGKYDQALRVLREDMPNAMIKPNHYIFWHLIRGLARGGRLDDSLRVMQEAKEKYGLTPNQFMYNAVIAACVQCERPDLAWQTFEELREAGLKQREVMAKDLEHLKKVNAKK